MKVNLITAFYNSFSTIAACIASVYKQTYSNIEHIIASGGATYLNF